MVAGAIGTPLIIGARAASQSCSNSRLSEQDLNTSEIQHIPGNIPLTRLDASRQRFLQPDAVPQSSESRSLMASGRWLTGTRELRRHNDRCFRWLLHGDQHVGSCESGGERPVIRHPGRASDDSQAKDTAAWRMKDERAASDSSQAVRAQEVHKLTAGRECSCVRRSTHRAYVSCYR